MMHFHLFPPPPPFHVMPILLTAALAFAAGAYVVSRRGVPNFVADFGNRIGDRLVFWRKACDRTRTSRSSARHDAHSPSVGNTAFDEYRNATLKKLEADAAEFHTFLDGLRSAGDAADFEAFLKNRGSGGTAPQIS